MLYDNTTPRVVQGDSWSCSCATTAWVLQSLGIYAPYYGVERDMLNAGLVTSQDGLLVGSAGPLQAWVRNTYGLVVDGYDAPVPWGWLLTIAGHFPVAIGSSTWYHWSGVRGVNPHGDLLLANPADGHMGVRQEMTEGQFNQLGPFTAWWVEVAEEDEDVGEIAELINRLGYLQGDVADALQAALDRAKRARKEETRDDAYDQLQAAIETLKTEGK